MIQSLRKTWWARGFTFNHQTDPPGKKWATHFHAVDEIVRLVDGMITIQAGRKVRRPKAGEETIIPRGTPHRISNRGHKSAKYLYGFRNKKR